MNNVVSGPAAGNLKTCHPPTHLRLTRYQVPAECSSLRLDTWTALRSVTRGNT
jgi:hypothetical protein